MTRGSVDEVTGGGDGRRDGRAVSALLLGVFRCGQHRDLAQPFVFRGSLIAPEVGESVATQNQSLDDGRADTFTR